ncbi:unnamed protein product, partial [Cercopithifilaria johnstoni]
LAVRGGRFLSGLVVGVIVFEDKKAFWMIPYGVERTTSINVLIDISLKDLEGAWRDNPEFSAVSQ